MCACRADDALTRTDCCAHGRSGRGDRAGASRGTRSEDLPRPLTRDPDPYSSTRVSNLTPLLAALGSTNPLDCDHSLRQYIMIHRLGLNSSTSVIGLSQSALLQPYNPFPTPAVVPTRGLSCRRMLSWTFGPGAAAAA